MMKILSFLYSKNTLFGILSGFLITTTLAFKFLSEPRGCAVALDKMNVFYVGFDNPITLVVRGVPREQLKVQSEGITVVKSHGDHYVVRASTPGNARITVSGGNLKPVTFHYRVKEIPDPTLCLGGNPKWTRQLKEIDNSEFKAQGGLSAVMDAGGIYECMKCDMVSFRVSYMPQAGGVAQADNTGARFGPETQALINQAKPGDRYVFDKAKGRCPGDTVAKDLSSMSFIIK